MNNLQNYIIKLDSSSDKKTWLSAKIVDDEDSLIGNIKGTGSFRMQISWLKTDGSLLISSHKRAVDLRDIYDIKDSTGKLLGIVKRKSLLDDRTVLKNPDGNDILTSKKVDGKSIPSFEIRDEEGKLVAKIEFKEEKIKAKNWIERYFTGTNRISCIFSIKDFKSTLGK